MAPYKDDPIYNVKFVKEIQKYPCIYNSNLSDYSKKDATDLAWEKIAKEMKDTVSNCKEKWRNLRTVFVRKLKPSPPKESGIRGKKPYYMMEEMKFLLPYVKVSKPLGITEHFLLSSENQKQVNEIVYKNSNIYDNNEDENTGSSERQHFIDLLPDNLPQIHEESLTSEDAAPSAKKQKTSSTLTINNDQDQSYLDHINPFLELLKMKSKMTSEDDPRKQFLLSLRPDINQMTDIQMRRFKRKVLDLVEDILGDVTLDSNRTNTSEIDRPIS